ncbi:MAG: hypothetical protein WBF77_04905 [Sulfurimonadaceae bacterium]
MTTVEIAMMVAFVLTLSFSGWKLYAFMPNKPLEDDDTTATSVDELKTIMYEVIHAGELEEETIFTKMKDHPKFDHEHFWRFNHNRLKQLLNSHYLKNPHHKNVAHIHHHLKETKDR